MNELDAQEANTRDTFVYKLKNATATEVARVVNEFVSEDQRKILETLSADELPSASATNSRASAVLGHSSLVRLCPTVTSSCTSSKGRFWIPRGLQLGR